jgi:hypothetical protein
MEDVNAKGVKWRVGRSQARRGEAVTPVYAQWSAPLSALLYRLC